MGADVNAKDTDGDTPLKAAKDSPFLPAGVANPVTDVLLRHGAKE